MSSLKPTLATFSQSSTCSSHDFVRFEVDSCVAISFELQGMSNSSPTRKNYRPFDRNHYTGTDADTCCKALIA